MFKVVDSFELDANLKAKTKSLMFPSLTVLGVTGFAGDAIWG